MVTKKVYPLPSEIEEVECCYHGIPLDEFCEGCAIDDEGDERYHALKDDGKLTGYYDNPDDDGQG